LLEASGELSAARRERLYAYFAKHPEAQSQYEQIKGQLALLRSMPRVEMSEQSRRAMATNIKQGVQKKLRQMEREALSNKRWKLIYQSMAGISAAAAAVIIVAGVIVINQSIAQKNEQERIVAVTKAIDNIVAVAQASDVNDAIDDLKDAIRDYQDQSSKVAGQDKAMHNLMTELATVTDADEITPPPEPGAL